MSKQATRKNEVIGTWEVEVTLRNCDTGASLKTVRAVSTFTGGGALIESGARVPHNLTSPGQGTWKHIGGQSYSAVLRFFRFKRDGSVAETRKVTRHLELSKNGEQFTGTACVEIFDANDSLIVAHCATETAKRFE